MCKKLMFPNSMSGKSRPLPNLPKEVRIVDPHEHTIEEIARILLRKRADEPEEQPKLGKSIKSLLMAYRTRKVEEPPTE